MSKEESNSKNAVHGVNCILLLAFLFVVLLSGCSEPDPTFSDQNKAARKACIDKGGVPIRSAWSSQMGDCVFPPEGRR